MLRSITNNTRVKKHKNNKNILVFILFFVLASLFWLIKTFNKSYTVDVDVAVDYSNLPTEKALLNHPPHIIHVTIKAVGFSILTHYMYGSKTITVDFLQMLQEYDDIPSTITIKTKSLLESAHIFSSGIEVLKISQPAIAIQFAPIAKKKLPIIPIYSIENSQQYQLKSVPTFSPDSIWVYGAFELIDSLQYVRTNELVIKNYTEAIAVELSLQHIENLSYSHDAVHANFEFEKYTEQNFKIPITIENLPDSILIDLVQHEVAATVFTGMSKAATLSAIDFKAIADFTKKNNTTAEIPIEIRYDTTQVKLMRLVPETVSYIEE